MSDYDYFKKTIPYHESRTQYQPSQATEVRVMQTEPKFNRYSDLLPKSVLTTLNSRSTVINNFKAKCEIDKKRVNDDFDALLRDLIIIFENFKTTLYGKIDEHFVSFSNFINQLDTLAIECSNWAEERMQQAQTKEERDVNNEDLLYQQLNEVRISKQRADEFEKALVAIKQKIDQMRLNELTSDINFLVDERNLPVYNGHEVNRISDTIIGNVKGSLNNADQNKLIKPFMIDTKVVNQPDNRAYKINLNPKQIQFNDKSRVDSALNVTPELDTNKNALFPSQNNLEPSKLIIAQQNHFVSDAIDLTNPFINLEREIYMQSPSKLTVIQAISARTVLVGNEDGNLIIADISSTHQNNQSRQTVIKAHSAPIRLLKKFGNNMLLSSAISPDNSMKLWDFSQLLTNVNASSINVNEQLNGSIMLLSVLKGHTDTIIGTGFIDERNIISASRDGVINIWDWKLNTPMESYRIQNGSVTNFLLLGNNDGFVVSMNSGSILSYTINKTPHGYDFIKTSEIREPSPVIGLYLFRGNNDLLITSLQSGEVKLISRRSGQNLNTISGCKNPFGFFVITCLKSNPDILLMALESYGFKIADVDHTEFAAVNTRAMLSFRSERLGEPSWQILDSVVSKKILFATINQSTQPNAILVWSLQQSD